MVTQASPAQLQLQRADYFALARRRFVCVRHACTWWSILRFTFNRANCLLYIWLYFLCRCPFYCRILFRTVPHYKHTDINGSLSQVWLRRCSPAASKANLGDECSCSEWSIWCVLRNLSSTANTANVNIAVTITPLISFRVSIGKR